jgi:TolC family type I secretion outer membrane protein
MIAVNGNSARRTLAAVLVASWPALAPAMTLSDAFKAAQQYDPTYRISEAQYRADKEAGIIARASLKPRLDLQGTATHAHTESDGVFGSSSDGYDAWSAGAQLRQPLFRLDWFGIGDRAKALDSQAEIAHLGSQLDLQMRVAQRYFGVLIAKAQLAQATAEAKAVAQSLANTQQRYDVELVPGTDLKEAQARNDLAQASLLAANRDMDNALDEFAETTGAANVQLPALPENVVFPALIPADVQDWVTAAQQNSTQIATATQSEAIALTQLSSAKATALPTLDLVGSVGRDDTSEYIFGQKSDDARIGVELNIPLYAGGATQAALRQARAQYEVAQADLQRVQREVERLTRQQFRTLQTTYAEVSAYERALASAQVAEVATRNGYEAGTRTITDVLDAQSRVVQARRNLDTTRYNLLLDLLQLKQTVGRLSPADFAEVDRLLTATPSP